MGEQRADEQQLIAHMTAYQKGSMADLEELYAALEKPLRRYLWTFVRNSAQTDDLLQDVFLQLHRARHTYMPPRPVRPWIYAISRHVALMHLRSAGRRREVQPGDELPEVPVPPDLEELADRETVQRLLTMLPHQAQEVLILHHLLGLSFKEVGRILGIAAGTAKVRAHRALKALRSKIEEQGGVT